LLSYPGFYVRRGGSIRRKKKKKKNADNPLTGDRRAEKETALRSEKKLRET
jgi:hypothetical protein